MDQPTALLLSVTPMGLVAALSRPLVTAGRWFWVAIDLSHAALC